MITMISIILLVRHLAQAHNEHQAQPEEDKPESNATCKANCGESGEGDPDRQLLRTARIGSFRPYSRLF